MFTINANGQGISSHLITSFARRLNARSITVLNEPKVAAELLTFVPFVTYRMIDKGAGAGIKDDDYAHHHHDPIAFVNARHAEAPPGCALYLTNEPGDGDLEQLNDWTLRAIDQCVKLGRKPVPFNFQVLAPKNGVSDWKKVKSAGVAALQAGGRIGTHIYLNRTAQASRNALRVIHDIKEVFGDATPIEVNEYAIAIDYDPHKGWIGELSEAKVIAEGIEGVTYVNAPNVNYHWYIFGTWYANPSFAITDAQIVQDGMVEFNRKAPPMTQPPTNPYGKRIPRGRVTLRNMGSAKNVRVRNAPTTSGSEIVGSLFGGEELPYYETTINGWRKIEFNGAPAFVSDEFTVFEEVVDPFPPFEIPIPSPEFDPSPEVAELTAQGLEWLAQIIRQRGAQRVS